VTRSGAGFEDWTQDEAPPVQPAPAIVPVPSPATDVVTTDVILPEAVSEEDRATDLSPADGFGAFLKAQVQPSVPAKPAAEVVVPPPAAVVVGPPPVEQSPELALHDERVPTSHLRRPTSNSPAPTPTPAPMNASSIQKMKDMGMYRNQYFKDAECFDCGHKFKTSRSARSANCPTCGAYISLEDVEINMNATQPVKTRGDVIIRKRGHLAASSLQCRDLRCFGNLEANVECSGDAIFKATGTVIGEIRCRRFIVEKGSDLVFKNPIRAEEVDIQARITGNVFSSGLVLIGANGSVNGDVTARSVSIEPGGELNGAMNIVRGKPATPPPAAS
jgi:cytoskeletal protein CcmA (bactofilin family)